MNFKNRNFKNEVKNRKLKGTFKSKLKSHFKIEYFKGTLTSKLKVTLKSNFKSHFTIEI